MHSKVSAVLATYNGEKFLRQQLASIIGQTRPPDEIVISDDNSSDRTRELASELLAASGIAFRIVSNKYAKGYSNNFQNGLEVCSGDVVFLSDQDDYWHPSKVAVVLKAFDDHPNALLVLHDMQIGDANLNPRDSTYLEELRVLGIGHESYCSGCAMALKREFVDLLLPFPDGLEDHDIWINEYAKLVDRRAVVEKPLTIYRRHGSNLTTNQIFTKNLLKRIGSEIDSERRGTFLKRQFLINSELLARAPRSRGESGAGELTGKFDELRKAIAYCEFRITAKSLPLRQRLFYILGNRTTFWPKPTHVAKDILLPFYK